MAHDPPLGGHLGINKTYHKVLAHFYWPRMKQEVADLRYRLVRARHFAQKNLSVSQQRMKTWYDKRAKSRHFNIGDQVLV